MMLQKNRLNLVIDGQFGSTGKGLLCGYLALKQAEIEPIRFCITNASPNAGHTVDFNDGRGKLVCYHLPVSCLINKNALIYLCAGSIIDPDLLNKEIEYLGVDKNQIVIHPHAAVVLPEHKEQEQQPCSSATKIASTQKGVGTALANKIQRKGNVAINFKDTLLKEYRIQKLNVPYELQKFSYTLMEVPQGFGLSVNHGFYPYTTSRDITPMQALNDVGLSSDKLGSVHMSVRTLPIRVGNILDQNGEELGYSGPFYSDSKEKTWEELGLPEELTTVTKRVRRIATFSHDQYHHALEVINPTHVFLNFCNYLTPSELKKLCSKLPVKPSLYGFGPSCKEVHSFQGMKEILFN